MFNDRWAAARRAGERFACSLCGAPLRRRWLACGSSADARGECDICTATAELDDGALGAACAWGSWSSPGLIWAFTLIELLRGSNRVTPSGRAGGEADEDNAAADDADAV